MYFIIQTTVSVIQEKSIEIQIYFQPWMCNSVMCKPKDENDLLSLSTRVENKYFFTSWMSICFLSYLGLLFTVKRLLLRPLQQLTC